MLRTRLAKSYIKRTIRPLYAWTQATPKSVFLDPAWDRSVPVYPGFVVAKSSGENVMPLGYAAAGSAVASHTDGTALTGVFGYGLAGLYVGGDGIDEVLDSGINAFACWVLTPDAEFEILAPAYNNTDAGIVEGALLGGALKASAGAGGATPGQLVPVGAAATYTATNGTSNLTTQPLVRVLKVNSPTKITVGGLYGTL